MKTYVLTIAKTFPSYHKRKGQETNFIKKIALGEKLHTIRMNYELWEKRFIEIEKGEAILSVRIWSGKSYRSKQQEIFKYDKTHGIGLQKLEQPNNFVFAPIDGKKIDWVLVAKNDGLSFEDFCDWFKVRIDKPMAIIHFTSLRYL